MQDKLFLFQNAEVMHDFNPSLLDMNVLRGLDATQVASETRSMKDE